MIRTVIIEDEVNSQDLLRQMLTEYCEGVEVLGVADDVASGIELIRKVNPDVIFLDVEMPGGNGFDILNTFSTLSFKIIFVTGYSHYAIKAIKYAALDYLLKPINLKELRLTIQKIKETIPSYMTSLEFLKNQLENTTEANEITKIVISDNRSHKVVELEDVIYLEAERTYVTFYLTDNRKYVATNPLNYYKDLLPDTFFFRIHKSYLINCRKVLRLDAGRGGSVHLQEGAALPIAFRRKPAFVRFLEKNV